MGGRPVNWLEFAMLHAEETCTVEVAAVRGASGYAEPVVVGPCVIADATVCCPPDTVAPPGSLITLPTGDTVRVVGVHYLDPQGTRLPEHLQLDLGRRAVGPVARARLCRPIRGSLSSPRR
jgi:hypothetical protein